MATAAGYGFGRFRFRFSGTFGLILLTLMIPFQAMLTPLFLELNAMGLTNSRLGLACSTDGEPAVRHVRDAHRLRLGAGRAGGGRAGRRRGDDPDLHVTCMRPLVVPGMATTALYAFLASWTEFLGALTFLTSENLYTLPVVAGQPAAGHLRRASNYGLLAAGSVIAMIPCVILFVALQRYYVEGIAAGGGQGLIRERSRPHLRSGRVPALAVRR